MNLRTLLGSLFLGTVSLLLLGALTARPSLADSGHARIIRLSLVQGDVRVARELHGDDLANDKVNWEAAELNLPIRQGYALATDRGRAEVEFENGTMMFLANDTVVEFYDLSLDEGEKTTRLVLRRGTASFYVNPGSGDYFSVTGGDFTVAAEERATFRLDNADDGSTVNVAKGRVSVLRKNKTLAVSKGESLSMRAGEENSVAVSHLPGGDDFDRWVSGRVDSVSTATVAAQQYVNGPYTSGLADLYTYGSWFPLSGYGYGWRPYGMGFGWSPFTSGGWYNDPFCGLSFIGSQPWGWLPYHYGGWIFDPGIGWLWAPGGFGRPGFSYVGVTGIFVRNRPGLLGIVPAHPLDARGKTPVNLARGVFPVNGNTVATQRVPVATSDQWKALKSAPKETAASIAASSTILRAVRAPAPATSTARGVTVGRDSSIAFDRREHRFINSNSAPANHNSPAPNARVTTGAAAMQPGNSNARVVGVLAPRASVPGPAAPARTSATSMPRSSMPPPAARSSAPTGAARGGWSGGGTTGGSSARGWSGGSASSSASSAGASRSSAPSAPSGGRPH
jgi:FecR protein